MRLVISFATAPAYACGRGSPGAVIGARSWVADAVNRGIATRAQIATANVAVAHRVAPKMLVLVGR
jgi:hypothetical protein